MDQMGLNCPTSSKKKSSLQYIDDDEEVCENLMMCSRCIRLGLVFLLLENFI